MFESLSDRLSGIFSGLTRRGRLSESDVEEALREVRVALLEADVALPVVKDLMADIRAEAVGGAVLDGVSPGQQVIKIVHDGLVRLLGEEGVGLDLAAVPPVPVMMVGLQGSGKTTTTGKLARHLASKEGGHKSVLMASLDMRRPAAQAQLVTLGEQLGLPVLPPSQGVDPVTIARRAMERARLEGIDVVLLDTAGRLHVDEALMAELAAVRDAVSPQETLFVADAMTGQDAVNTARAFHERIGLSGIILTRIDGDARGGAALSMGAVTGKPIKFMGTGEKLDALDAFHPDRIARRILGMGDVISLVEKAAETVDQAEAERLARKVKKGDMDLNDLAAQLRQLRKMGGFDSVLNLLPGMGKMRKQVAANVDEKTLLRQEAILSSMTDKERCHPNIIKASRKKRIAAGAGVGVQDVNRLLKQYAEMSKMMKRMGKMEKSGMLPTDLANMVPPR